MTEKDYLNRLGFAVEGDEKYNRLRLWALKLAKEAGAEFDPEPVELPNLIPIKLTQLPANGFAVRSYDCTKLTLEQAEEIIRRCWVVDKLKSYILLRFARMSNGEMVDIRTHELTPGHASDFLGILDGRK